MDIIKNLMEAIPLMDGDNKGIVQDLLVKKLQEQADAKKEVIEVPQWEKDLAELQNYNGGESEDE